MSQPSPQNPPPHDARRVSLATVVITLLCITTLACSVAYLLIAPAPKSHQSSLAQLLQFILIASLTVLLTYAALCAIAINIVRAVEFAAAGRLSPNAFSWVVAVVLGGWGLVAFFLTAFLLSHFSETMFGQHSLLAIFLQILFWLFFILVNPLALLVTVRYIQAKRQLAARLLLIQAAGLVSAGVDPVRALTRSRPGSSYVDRCQNAITQSLQKNLTFAQALAQNIPYLSRADKALLLAAERMGVLAPALRQKSQELQKQTKGSLNGFVPSIIVMEWSAMVIFVLSIMIFVIPKFEKIFEDFGTDLPITTRNLLYTAKYLMGTYPGQAVPGMFYLFILITLVPVFLIFCHFLKPLFHRLLITTRLPVISDLLLRSSLVETCFFLSHTLRAGIDLPAAVAQARTLEVNPAVSTRLLAWETAMRSGLAPAQAAQHAGLPHVMAAFIQSAQHGPAMGDAMDRLANYYQNQVSRTRIVLETLIVPAAILLTGAVIGFVVIALFEPLTKLIIKLT